MDQSQSLRGMGLMVLSMACFAGEDMFIKLAAANMGIGQILVTIGIAGALVFGLFAAATGSSVLSRDLFHPAVMVRNAGEVVGTFGFVTGLALLPLSTLSAIFMAMPLAVTFGAALFLNEAVGWRRWTAIAVGFGGVMLIIRPGLEGFRTEALWGLVAVFGLALRDLATRKVPGTIGTARLSAWGFASVVPIGLFMQWAGIGRGGEIGGITTGTALFIAAALSLGIVGYSALTAASRIGEVSTITPFRYSRLVFALIIGVLVFSERPDALTLTGAAIIIGSGLYAFARERRLRTLSMRADAR